MGVEARVLLYAETEARARAAAKAAFDRMIELDHVLSDYQADSELNRLVARGPDVAVPVSEDLFAVLAAAQEFSRRSGGAFDVTVKPLVQLWKGALKAGREPEAQALEQVLRRVGFEKLCLDPKRRTVLFRAAGMALDLGAIGKGYACDEALEVLKQEGVESALIDLGGDLVLGAPPPGRKGWTVSLGCGGREILVALSECAVATSGDTEQFTVLESVRYSHILDPRSGRPLADAPCVSVVARDGMTADALASAASVLGIADGRRLVAAQAGAWVEFADPRFVPLFDGVTLDGWRAGSKGDAPVFGVEDGALTGRVGPGRPGGEITTERAYTCFELELDGVLDPSLEAGLRLPLSPDVPAVEIPFGGPRAVAPFLEGEWNHLVIRVSGASGRIDVWLNGARIRDGSLLEGPPGPAGRIGLWVRGGAEPPQTLRARFKNLRIREIRSERPEDD